MASSSAKWPWNDPKSLIGRCIQGGSVLALGSLVDNFLRFARNVFLARLLLPEAFGEMATVLAVVAAAEAFAEVGLRQSVIQNPKGAEEDFLNVVWWLSLLRASVLFCVAWLAAPWLCAFVQKQGMPTLMRFGFTVLLLNGLISPRTHVLEKELRYAKWVILVQGSGVLSVLGTIVFAFYIRNAWALVIGYVMESFLRSALSFVVCPFMPRLRLSGTHAREVLTYSRRIWGLPILMMLFVQVDSIVIAKVLSMQGLGLYAMGRDLADLPNKIASRVSPIVLPTLSLIQDDRARMRGSLIASTTVVGTFGVPLMTFAWIFSEKLLSLVYGPAYAVVALPFSVLCVCTLIAISSSLLMYLYMAVGRPDFHRTASAVRTCLFLLIIYPAVKLFGLLGASVATLAAMITSLLMQLVYARRVIDLSGLDYCAAWLPGLKLSLIVAIPGLLLRWYFASSGLGTVIVTGLFCLIAWGIGISKLGFLRAWLPSKV